tara:strand:- start:207 stop:665 length:459 start_codon:yes stop_codon:yes gene_type:complete
MIWLCLICNTENDISEADYESTEKTRYCKKCRTLDSLCFANYDRRQYLLDTYLLLNHKIDSLVPTDEIYPMYNITNEFVNQFNVNDGGFYSYYNPNKESILKHIRYRLYYNSVNNWEKHRRRVSNKKYKRLLKTKFLTVLPIRPVSSILDFI